MRITYLGYVLEAYGTLHPPTGTWDAGATIRSESGRRACLVCLPARKDTEAEALNGALALAQQMVWDHVEGRSGGLASLAGAAPPALPDFGPTVTDDDAGEAGRSGRKGSGGRYRGWGAPGARPLS
jgi:hypothetical protein